MSSKDSKTLIVDFTTGSVPKELLIFAAPLFLSNTLQIVYNMVDMVVVGRSMGNAGLAAISVGGDITSLMSLLAMGFSNAGSVVISQFIGADRKDRLSRFVGTMFTFLMGWALIVSILMLLLRRQVLGLMNTPEESIEYAVSYITICALGLVFIYGYNIVSAVLRGFGDSKHPFVFISIASAMNIVLDVIFVLGFKWGPGGAALATVISQTFSFGYAVIFLIRNKDRILPDFTRKCFIPDGELLGILLRLGLPMAIKQAAVMISKMFLNSWINSYGLVVATVSGVANKLNTVAVLFSNSVNTAGSSMIGQNIGAEKYKRVSKIMLMVFGCSFITSTLLSIILVARPEFIFGLFTTENNIMSVALEFVPIGVMVFYGACFRAPMNALINGGGNYKLNFAVALLDGIINRLGFGLLFGKVLGMNYTGFWLGDALASFTPFFIGGIYYLSGKWKTRKYIIKEK